MTTEVTQFKTLSEVTKFFTKCISKIDNGEDDLMVAGWMTGIVSNDHFDDWYRGADSDYLFAELFDYVTDLELPNGPGYYREAKWQMVRALVRMLEEKYPDRA